MARRFLAPTLALLLFALVAPIVAERAPVDADVPMRRTPGFSGLEPGTANPKTNGYTVYFINWQRANVKGQRLGTEVPGQTCEVKGARPKNEVAPGPGSFALTPLP